MSIWSRLNSLFPHKPVQRSSPIPPQAPPPTPALPEPTATPVDNNSLPEPSVGLAGNVESTSPVIGNTLLPAEHNHADVSGASAIASAGPADSWAAARRRPLVYAHKLRLGPEEVATSQPVEDVTDDQGTLASSPGGDHGKFPQTRENFASSESIFENDHSAAVSSGGDSNPEAERSGASESAVGVGSPTRDGSGTLSVLSSSDGDPSEQTRRSIGRFSMLRRVAQQWRPAVRSCRYLVIVGSTTEARKLAPVVRILRTQHTLPEEIRVCISGGRVAQVRDALSALQVPVDMEMTFSAQGLSIDELRTQMIRGFGKLLHETKPEWILVEGESVTTAMASIAAYYAQIPVAHIDGGTSLGTEFPIDESDPAVLHHRIAELFASMHFADTAVDKERLVREGIPQQSILVTGNTGVDTMQEVCAALGLSLSASSSRASGVVHVLVIVESPNTIEHGLPDLCRAIQNLVRSVPGLYQVVWPLVGDATSVQFVSDLLDRVPGVLLSGPSSYEQYLRLLSQCDLVLTDVEDVQEEAPSFGKPVLLMQASVKRPEAQRAGITTLTANDAASIQAGVRTLARKLSVRHGSITNPYGDGKAAARISDFFEGRPVLQFGKTALPKLLDTDGPSPARLLTSPSQ